MKHMRHRMSPSTPERLTPEFTNAPSCNDEYLISISRHLVCCTDTLGDVGMDDADSLRGSGSISNRRIRVLLCDLRTDKGNAPINPFAQSIDRDASTFAAGPAMMSINDVRYDYSLSGNFLASARGVSSSGDVPPACSRSTTWVR